MIKKLALLLVGITIAFSVAAPASTFALFSGSKSQACSGLDLNGTATGGSNCSNGTNTLEGVLHTVIVVFSAIVGIIAVIMIIVSGLKFITAGGESSAVASARSTLLYAIIGLIVAALAQVIAHFVVAKSTQTATGATSSYSCTTTPTLQQGSTGGCVKEVQNAVGVVQDGKYGTDTKTAVIKYQQQHGIPADGVVGPQTWAAINGS
ncbi:MAG TPA: peptidoglycan-binding protein [Candidatus Saccharimonadales bacterium]|nr:peptidoglycan-binding protein [Candidatus Saccharimonadales bacterium]